MRKAVLFILLCAVAVMGAREDCSADSRITDTIVTDTTIMETFCDTVDQGYAHKYTTTGLDNHTATYTLETTSGDADLYVCDHEADDSFMTDYIERSTYSGTTTDSVTIDCYTGTLYVYVYGYEASDYCLTDSSVSCSDSDSGSDSGSGSSSDDDDDDDSSSTGCFINSILK